MFILNSQPDHGFVSQDTNITFKFGLDKEKCLEKINQADDEYVQSISNLEERLSYMPNNENTLIRLNSSDSPRVNLEEILNRLSLSKFYKFKFIIFLVDGNLNSLMVSESVDNHRVELAISK